MKRLLFLLTLAICICLAGCTPGKNHSSLDGMLTVSPSTLFEGDAKKLQPHLDIIGGCVKIEYKGSKKWITSIYEIWEDGKLISSAHGISKSIQNGIFYGVFSISLKDKKESGADNEYQVTTVLSKKDGFVSSTHTIPRFNSSYGYGPEELPGTISIRDNKEIVVWGLTADKDSYKITGEESIEKTGEKSNWAMIVKLVLTDGDNNERPGT